MAKTDMDRELKKGSTELLILSLLEGRARHGYDIGRQIEQRSQGVVELHVASLYPLLYRLERRGWVEAEWGTSELGRQAKFYRITAKGRRQLAADTEQWARFSAAVTRVLIPGG